MKYINRDNLFDYAFLNEDTLVYPVRAVCVCFHGYTDATIYDRSNEEARSLGERGIAWVFPYYSVWAWMSKSSQSFCEQVLDAVYDRLGIDEDVPLVVSGGSMGGLTALNYLVYGKRPAIACALNCPVTDMNRIFEDRRDFRRAILSAHIEEDGELSAIMEKYSPVRFADRLPKIPYFLVFGEDDPYFIKTQMPPIVERFKECGISHVLRLEPGMKHCDLVSHNEAFLAYCGFLICAAENKNN
ncbi:MAG: hypothetical protein IJY23_08870 [Clostridia bacterium]|nr:hypothetical protein [Clostridia bacterium]